MSDTSIVRDGANVGDGLCAFDHTVLDKTGFYPADMSALPTSTPNPANLRRKSRRSWFETTPKGFKFEIAVEKPVAAKRPARKSETVEVLTLSHFSSAPRLDFGTLKLGQEKTCTLLLRNPHEYEQSVKVEKVPEKKHFSVPLKQFVVGAEESYPLEITWSPKEAGGCREMVLMQVDGSYRVQAYVFGQVTAPPAQKKKGKRVGLLASKAARPFSVIHTTSLANINTQYSPEKNPLKQSTKYLSNKPAETRSKASKNTNSGPVKTVTQSKSPSLRAQSKSTKNGFRSSKDRKSSEGRRRSARLSDKFDQRKSVTRKSVDNDENIEPVELSEEKVIQKTRKSSERKASLPKPKIAENIPRKKMRRSNTYSNVSGLGLVVPIIQGEKVKGLKDTSLLAVEDCNISGIQALDDSGTGGVNCNLEPSFLEPKEGKLVQHMQNKKVPVTNAQEPSFLEGDGDLFNGKVNDSHEPSFLQEERNTVLKSKVVSEDHKPSFLECRETHKVVKSSVLTAVRSNEEFHDSLEKGNQSTGTPSFLQPERNKSSKTRRSLRKRSGKVEKQNESKPTEVKLLRGVKRNNARTLISPETFIKDVYQSNDECGQFTDENTKINDSLGQCSILEQLKCIKSFVHDKSLEIEKSGTEVVEDGTDRDCLKEVERRETFVKCRMSPRFSVPGSDINIRRGTFVSESVKLKMLETQKPSEASPRRTTFTVIKGSNNAKKHVESRLNDDAFVLQEEEEISAETEEKSDKKDVAADENEQDRKMEKESGRLFSADSLEDDSFEKQTEPPQEIFAEQKEVFTRRATLTVTKSRPSDALLEHAQRSAAAMCLFDENSVNVVETIPEVTENEKDDQVSRADKPTPPKSCQNSTFEVPSENSRLLGKDSSFPTTPYHLLPTSPQLDHSRRSTHIVEKPKVVNLSKVNSKELFVKQDKIDHDESDIEVEQDSLTEVKPSIDELQIQQGVERNIVGEQKVVVAITEDTTDLNNRPSSNTRRRKLSARRSVHSLGRHSAEKVEANKLLAEEKDFKKDEEIKSASNRMMENEIREEVNDKATDVNGVQSSQEIFFVPFDNKSEIEEPANRQSKKPDPRQFLKKRSSSTNQLSDKLSKRAKSEKTDTDKKQGTDGVKGSQKIQRQSAVAPSRVRRQAVKSVGSVQDVSTHTGLKPKAGIVKGLATSKLILSKKSKSAIPKHPLPFAAKNMFYDERWMEKQERGFVNWLNFILTPPEEHQGSDVKVKVDAGKLTLDVEKGRTRLAPTNEILSFRTYSAQRKLNRLRKSACRLFQSDPMRRVLQKIEGEVESNRLLVRKDKMIHADLGAKQKVLDMLLSYNPLWLRVGLETIFGEVVPLQSNTDVYGLSRFVILRVLASPDIAEEYAHPTVPHLYRDGYAEASAQYTLKRFLMLVYFLDQAKQHRLIEHNPCLFCKNADIKASKDLLLQFSRDFLSGEGDITRHLGYLGYKVTYSQTALDEFDFAVKTLATDLRDGLRLTRVLEIICSKTELSKSLRVPAISRLQKIHNVDVVFNTLKQQSIETGNVTSRDIVDGHRERTLSLLWMIILHYQVAMVINVDQLKEEIEVLERSVKLKKKLHKLENLQTGSASTRRESEGPDLHTQDERLNLLMKWCRAVCAFFGIKIENFTVSFSDGRALCHILHYYHPGLLPLSLIKQETTMTHLENFEKNEQYSMNCSLNDSVNSSAVFGDVQDPAVYEQLLANEKDNFKMLSEKVKELGGVPLMLRWSDMSNTIPDEKVVVTYLMYLCARLLDIRHESRAARVIQHAWRAYRLRKMEAEYKVKGKAVVVIQRAVRKFLALRREKHRESAALCIQSVWRGHRARCEARRLREEVILQQHMHAVRLLQNKVRCYLYRRRYLQMKAAVTQIQAYCRGYLLRKKFHMAATNIQRVYRGHFARQQVRKTKQAAVKIQAAVRGFLVRKSLQKCNAAAKTIQDRFRAYLEMKRQHIEYKNLRKSCIVIQKGWRKYLTVKNVKRITAAVKIQSSYRRYIARKNYIKLRESAIHLQAAARGYFQRQKLNACKKAVVLIQRRFRDYVVAKQQRHEFLCVKEAAVFLQSQRRMVIKRRKYLVVSASVLKLQAYARMLRQRQKFLRLKNSTETLQKYYRAYLLGRVARKDFLVAKGAAITIQASFRGHMVRQKMRKLTSAAVTIQSCIRHYLVRKRYLTLKAAAIACQQRFRANVSSCRERENYKKMRNSAITVQKMFRGKKCRQVYKRDRDSVVKVQSFVRMFLGRRRYMKIKQAVIVLQARFRSKQIVEACRRQYLIKLGATITLQAGVRGMNCRRQYQETRCHIIRLQASMRGCIQYRKFQKLKKSTVIIQRRLRDTLVARQQRTQFIQMKRAAVRIQSAWRMKKTRQEYLKMKHFIVVAQSAVRKFIHQKRYRNLKNAVAIIENYYQAKIIGKTCRRHFLVCKGAVLTIQAAFRGYRDRKMLQERQKAACRIQAWYRGYVRQKQYQQLKRVTIICQRRYKSIFLARKIHGEYVHIRNAAITIQAVFRGCYERKQYLKKRKSAIKIQSAVRGYLQQKRYQNILRSVVKTQRRIREILLFRQERSDYLKLKNAAVVVQSAWRMKQEQQKFKVSKRSVILIQSAVRSFLQQRKYQRLKLAASTLQKIYRAKKLGDSCRREFLVAKGAAMTIQAWFRGYIVRKQLRQEIRSATVIQAWFRSYSEHRRFLQLRNATLTCQRRYRAILIGRKMQGQFESAKKAVICLQAVVRTWKCRREFLKVKTEVLKIQTLFRMQMERRKYLAQRKAAVIIQQWFRGALKTNAARRNFLLHKGAAITIQAYVKMYLIRKLYLQTVARRKNIAAVRIQSWFRGVKVRNDYVQQKRAAVILQTRWRAELQCRQHVMQYHKLRDAVIAVQSMYRGMMARKSLRRNKAVVKIQANFRMFRQRKEFNKIMKASLTIQSVVRTWLARRRLEYLRSHCQQLNAAVTIQSGVRVWLARKQLATLKEQSQRKRDQYLQQVVKAVRVNMAAVKIQRCYRNHCIMKVASERLHSILVIQRWVRSRLQRIHYLQDKQRVIQLQARVRTWLARRDRAARVIQRAARKWLGSADIRKQNRAAQRIQALWRGFHVRKNIKNRRLTLLRKRVQEATASATEEKKLGNRTSSALDFLLRFKQLSQVLDALLHLEVASRLSGICCERMVEVNAVPVLYRLVRGCNRSLPHMEIIKSTVCILTNLAKYEKTRPAVYEAEGGVNTLVDLLQIYRGKCQIFTKTCTLIGIIALDTPCKMNILEDKKLVERLRSIHTLTARKHKLEETQRVTRAKMNASSLNATFVVRSPMKKQKIKPDWSLHKDKMSEIENPLKAIHFVLGNLGIQTSAR